jgi:hypothetical protein
MSSRMQAVGVLRIEKCARALRAPQGKMDPVDRTDSDRWTQAGCGCLVVLGLAAVLLWLGYDCFWNTGINAISKDRACTGFGGLSLMAGAVTLLGIAMYLMFRGR